MDWPAEMEKNFIKQKDDVNCGPIACLHVLEMLQGQNILDGMETMTYRHTVMEHFKLLVKKFNDELKVH